MATSSSIELECVFFSVTPEFGEPVEDFVGLYFQLPASSLIRIFFIVKDLLANSVQTPLCYPAGYSATLCLA